MEINSAAQNPPTNQLNHVNHEPIQEEGFKQRGSFLPALIVVLIVVIVGTGGYFLYRGQITPATNYQEASQPTPSPAPDETVKWKTYTNTGFGFSIKYPPNLQMEEIASDIFLLQIAFKEPSENVFLGNGFTVEIKGPGKLEDEIEYRRWRIIGHLADSIKVETEITKDGFKGTRLDYDIATSNPVGKKDFAVVIIATDKYRYVIESNSDLIDQVLSTLKFLGPKDEASSWKTYTSKVGRYSIKYPEGYTL